MAVNLVLQVARSADNRLSGTVRTISGSETWSFSGTLELMRVFEELVPVSGDTLQPAEADRDRDIPDPVDQ